MKYSKAVKLVVGIVIIAFVIVIMFAYVKNLDSTMKEDIIVALNEVGSHDIKSIEKEVQNCWDVLENIRDDFEQYDCETVSELQAWIVRNRAVANFQYLYLIDSEGKLYTDNFLIRGADDNDFLSLFDGSKNKFVMRYDRRENSIAEIEKELILYGVEITPFTVEGVKFEKILGMYDISAIREEFNITSFNDRGYSTVIESSGNYVVHLDETSDLGQRENFFEVLEDGRLEDSDIETVREKISASETFNISYSINGTEYEIELVPF